MYINDIPASRYGGNLKRAYTYAAPELDTTLFLGRKRSTPILLNAVTGMAKMTLPMVFQGNSRKEVTIKKSMFDALLFGQNDLRMDDGFNYFAILTDIGEATYPSDQLIEATYTFSVIRHGTEITHYGNTVICESTLPYTDCSLSVTVGAAGTNYDVGSVRFAKVTKGEKIVVDGMAKIIYVNGIPDATGAYWINFPTLTPGSNAITCNDTVTVTYYPVYF